MTRRSILPRVLCACLLAVACAKATEAPELGTNTNWLKACNEQAECGREDACVCGVCTRACDDDGTCGAVNAKTRCQTLNENACGSLFEAPASACLQACGSDGDCSALEHGRCVDGLCVPAPSGIPAESNTPNYELWRIDGEVVVTDVYTGCTADADCELVSKSCDGCCQLAAIDRGLSEDFESARGRACEGYRGAICDCDYLDLLPRCQAGRCRAIARDEATCYSPTQNLALSDRDDAVGCRCLDFQADICIEGKALVCEPRGGPINAWSSVADGPCGEAAGDLDLTCASGERTTTAQACVATYNSCYQLPGGDFCGLR